MVPYCCLFVNSCPFVVFHGSCSKQPAVTRLSRSKRGQTRHESPRSQHPAQLLLIFKLYFSCVFDVESFSFFFRLQTDSRGNFTRQFAPTRRTLDTSRPSQVGALGGRDDARRHTDCWVKGLCKRSRTENTRGNPACEQ